MTNSDSADTVAPGSVLSPDAGRWAPVWVLVFVALWPTPGLAETVLSLGAVFAAYRLLQARFRGGTGLLSGASWALTSVLFLAYWLPQMLSAIDALDAGRALRKAATDLRYLPFMWLCAMAVANAARRRRTFGGLAIIAGVWTLDALLQAVFGTSPLFFGLDQLKQVISGHGLCTAQELARVDRLSGVLGPCNLKFGQTLASLSPFLLVLVLAGRRGGWAWLASTAAVGVVLVLAGSRASWITFAVVVALSGWQLLGGRRLLLVALLGLLVAAGVVAVAPQARERITRTALAFGDDAQGVDQALSGRAQIWGAAVCMIRSHPFNGIGVRGFREAYPACDPAPSQAPAWGDGPAFHAHQLVLEILAETGVLGLLLWLAGLAQAWRAWRYSSPAAREQARPAMIALAATLFPLNTHLAFYSSFWGGLTLMLAGFYAGALLNDEVGGAATH
ncbi:O-antigen ligase family protein [Xanthomonas maliensis]|uniref:O-antigen ligase family protein n=1 Tax=Xanthomonas maliensis TaxID=1321368 RepID=UPI00039AE673|nr:O-antigen ligase family protein [Xanthomonas maliensis]KAB7767921.1 hypothetical protein CKY51_10915 [Xanthomonas maliensis]